MTKLNNLRLEHGGKSATPFLKLLLKALIIKEAFNTLKPVQLSRTLKIAIILLLPLFTFSQGNLQIVKGVVFDKQTLEPIEFAALGLAGTNKTATTDSAGRFKIMGVTPGRYDLQVSYVGYRQNIISSIDVTAGKEIYLEIGLEEANNSLNEIVVTGGAKKHETNNELVSVSGRSFSMEEVNRYSGGRSDPARLVANFAGVSAPNDSRNDIVVRGNSPSGVLWRIEGLNIPNPNHFSTIGTTGGAASALNTNILKNSDFFTSAFPAEYGNANAGVFDLGFRTGNTDKREYTFQLGALTGLEAMAEGPINKEKGSSYVIAYRYSFTGFAQQLGINIGTTSRPAYQDLSFKINSGLSKFGRFTLFGLGGTSNIDILAKDADSTDIYGIPNRNTYFKSRIGLLGLKHFIKAGKRSYFSTVIGATYVSTSQLLDTIGSSNDFRVVETDVTQPRYSANVSYNLTVNPKLFLKFGLMDEIINLNMFYRDRLSPPYNWNQIWNDKNTMSLYQAYAHAKYKITEKLVANVGVHSQWLDLNNSISVEPRLGLKYTANEKNTLSLGAGMHSQMQPIDAYFYQYPNADGSINKSNQNLNFTKSQHYVLGYEIIPVKNWRIKTEAYYQYLYNVPVTQLPGSYSMLNAGWRTFLYNQTGDLKNTGTGQNYGIELTLERFFSSGFYGLLTGSLYNSKYKGSDGIERNTGFNGKFVYNLLAGKEWKIGKGKRNKFNLDSKLTQSGGTYYTPVDYTASLAQNRMVFEGDDFAFSQRNPDFFRLDVKAGVTFNSGKRSLSQSFYLEVQNVTNNKNVLEQRYNAATKKVVTAYQIGFFPNFIYRLQF